MAAADGRWATTLHAAGQILSSGDATPAFSASARGGLRLAMACRAESRLRATILGPGSRLFLSLAARRFFWFADAGGRFALETEEKAGAALGSMEFCAVG